MISKLPHKYSDIDVHIQQPNIKKTCFPMSVKIIIIDMKIDLLNSFTHIIKYTPILYFGGQSYCAPLVT